MNPIDPSKAIEATGRSSSPPPGRAVTARVFAIFASAWPNREVSEPTLNLWASQIASVPSEVAELAAVECVRSCEFWPSVRTFLETVELVKAARRRRESVAPELVEGRNLPLAIERVGEIRRTVQEIAAAKNEEERNAESG